jgi:hypothetical protein
VPVVSRMGQRDAAAALADALGLVVLDAQSLVDLRQDVRRVIRDVRRHQSADRLADHLRCRVPEETLRATIPARHEPVERLPDDRVVRVLDDCREARVRHLELPALGQVVDHGHPAVGSTRRVARGVVDGADEPAADPGEIGFLLVLHALPGQHALEVRTEGLECVHAQNVDDPAPDDLVRRAADP